MQTQMLTITPLWVITPEEPIQQEAATHFLARVAETPIQLHLRIHLWEEMLEVSIPQEQTTHSLVSVRVMPVMPAIIHSLDLMQEVEIRPAQAILSLERMQD